MKENVWTVEAKRTLNTATLFPFLMVEVMEPEIFNCFVKSVKKGLTTLCHKSLLLFGGAEGDRTPDLMTASHALSQLSYSPSKLALNSRNCLLVSI